MKPFLARCLTVGIIGISLGWHMLRADERAPTPEKAAQNDIEKIAKDLAAKDVPERAKLIVKQHDSCDISSVFKMKRHGGFGIGKLTELGYQDSVEHFVINVGKRKTTTESDLEKYQADFLRVATMMQAMAELAPYRAPPHVKNDEKQTKKWAEVANDFKSKTAAFRKAIEEKDPK
jgi:hypothetical protein